MRLVETHIEDIIEPDVAFGGGALPGGGCVDVFGEAGGGWHVGCSVCGRSRGFQRLVP